MINLLLLKIASKCKTYRTRFYIYWNRFVFRIKGATLGKDSSMCNKIYLTIGEKAFVRIGSGFAISSGNNLNPLCANSRCSIFVANNAKLVIGNMSGISGGCIWATESIQIGNHVNIGANCIIIDGDIHNTDWRLRHIDRTSDEPIAYKHKPIVIDDDVWLGANSIVLKGVTIGTRTIIGAGSVVTKDIPANCIAAGNPCRVLKFLGGGK